VVVNTRRNSLVFVITAVATVALDQATKAIVTAVLGRNDSKTLIPGLLWITRVENKGAAFGMFSGSSQAILWISLGIVIVTLVWFFYARTRKGTLTLVALGLIVGGAVGNLVDRIFRGRVVDFIHLRFWWVFNVADIAIVAGVIIMVVLLVTELLRGQAGEAGGGEDAAESGDDIVETEGD